MISETSCTRLSDRRLLLDNALATMGAGLTEAELDDYLSVTKLEAKAPRTETDSAVIMAIIARVGREGYVNT